MAVKPHPDTLRLDKLEAITRIVQNGHRFWISARGGIVAYANDSFAPDGTPVFSTVREAIDAAPEPRRKPAISRTNAVRNGGTGSTGSARRKQPHSR